MERPVLEPIVQHNHLCSKVCQCHAGAANSSFVNDYNCRRKLPRNLKGFITTDVRSGKNRPAIGNYHCSPRGATVSTADNCNLEVLVQKMSDDPLNNGSFPCTPRRNIPDGDNRHGD